jgi:hypothetical protein
MLFAKTYSVTTRLQKKKDIPIKSYAVLYDILRGMFYFAFNFSLYYEAVFKPDEART